MDHPEAYVSPRVRRCLGLDQAQIKQHPVNTGKDRAERHQGMLSCAPIAEQGPNHVAEMIRGPTGGVLVNQMWNTTHMMLVRLGENQVRKPCGPREVDFENGPKKEAENFPFRLLLGNTSGPSRIASSISLQTCNWTGPHKKL